MKASENLEASLQRMISSAGREVFLHTDFAMLGSQCQVLRVLSRLRRQGLIIRIGRGIYARARVSEITGDPMPAAAGGFHQVALETLDRLGIDWELGEAWKAYNEGRTTQVPVRMAVRVTGRRRPRIRYKNNWLIYDNGCV